MLLYIRVLLLWFTSYTTFLIEEAHEKIQDFMLELVADLEKKSSNNNIVQCFNFSDFPVAKGEK